MQVDTGAYLGYQGSDTTPKFWIWCPSGGQTEHWVFYRYGSSGGFTPASSSVSPVSWKLVHTTLSSVPTDGCDFLDWVVQETGHAKSDLELRTHSITIDPCN